MYSEIMEAIKLHLEESVNAESIQVGYYGDMLQVDLRMAAILMEPMIQDSAEKDTRWKAGEFQIRLWTIVGMARDYMESMRELERILAADGADTVGIQASLGQLKTDATFRALSGTMGGKAWRIRVPVLQIGSTRFGINMRGSERVNTAQTELTVFLDIEK